MIANRKTERCTFSSILYIPYRRSIYSLLFVLSFLTGCSSKEHIPPKIENATIEISDWDFNKQPNLTKNGSGDLFLFENVFLDRKEIARLRFTSTEAVKKSRSRLRKRMHLQEKESLENYIKSI
ncbi:hypothetical protein [Aquimarina litoralis]|uniref:hypothetical protein n=1 Tax=Aquimarina litoralis TaxID=584605 RepID=UPI001C59104E|nr:hypothetical protein [Aquimarina litoralis]MBW1295372.1 hypothetical protein [Aquimarina litoralis]